MKIKSPTLVENSNNNNNSINDFERAEIEKLKKKLNQFSLQLASSTAHLIVKSQKEFLSIPSRIIASKEYKKLTSKITNVEEAMLF